MVSNTESLELSPDLYASKDALKKQVQIIITLFF
jgi:hypothetical protein